jgi:hypothetical protein
MGAIIAAFRKRFSRRHFLSLLYAQPMIDVLSPAVGIATTSRT